MLLVLLPGFTGCSTPAQQTLRDFEALSPVTIMDAPVPDPARSVGQAARGKYLVELLGCGSCHTDGALVGLPDGSRRLAGSHIGIAYSDPLRQINPGVVYPANLTPDLNTGLGQWSDGEIMQMITSGIDKHGRRKLAIMPWPAYTRLAEDDARAIIAYLRSLTPVVHQIPANVKPGEKAVQPFVYFGVYRKRP
jgi:mono/diheme cytochrome c family protein